MENDNNDIGGENMITVNATMSKIIKIGHQGENKAVQVSFDLTPFQSAFSGGHPQLVVRRPGDHSGYPVALIVDGSQAIWIVSDSDTEKAGHGQCELQWFVGDALAKSDKYNFLIYSSIPGDAEPPDVQSKAWFEKILSDIGDLSDLDTEAKENLVAAINEARQTGGGGAGGTNDHSKLINRDAADQHPIEAISGLEAALEGKQPAGSYLTEESDPTVPAWAKEEKKPSYTAQEVGADPSGTADGLVAAHNTAEAAHNDIRLLISGLTQRLNDLADSDDTTLDQLSEVVAYIKSNRELIASITTDKVSVADIIDNLTTNVANKPLSAAQGVALKALIDAISIPEKLPNPNALTFTGAATGSYDGSKPFTVDIPSVSVDDSLTQSGQAADAAKVGDALRSLSEEIANIPSGKDGADGITPTIGDNGNWYLGETDTGKPSRGEPGQDGAPGADGYTPKKGTDYWTADDQQAIVDNVLAALPTWEGGSY